MNETDVKFTVVIPTYNRLMELKRAVDSVLSQTFCNYELIIVDNESDDGTMEYCLHLQEMHCFIKYFKQKNSGSPAKGRNKGIKVSRGEWICFLDSDDIWNDTKLERLEQFITSNPEAVFISHQILWEYNNYSKVHRSIRRSTFALHLQLLLFGNFISNSSASVRRDVYDKLGMIEESKTFFGVEDFEFYLRLTRHYSRSKSYYFSNETLCTITENSAPFQPQINQNFLLINLMFKYIDKMDIGMIPRLLLKQNVVSLANYNIAIGMYYRKQIKKLYRYLFIAAIQNPFNIKIFKVCILLSFK